MYVKQFVSLIIVVVFGGVDCANILATVFSPSYSHQIIFRPLWKELAKRGHQITLLTTDPMYDPTLTNIYEIDLHGSYRVMEEHNTSQLITKQNEIQKSYFEMLNSYISALSETASWQFNQTPVQELIHNKSINFDLLILEVMYPAHLAFVDRFNAPFIGIAPVDTSPTVHDAAGNPTNPVLYPDLSLPFTKNLNFKERIASVLFFLLSRWYDTYYLYPLENLNVQKYFGKIRPLQEIQKDLSLLFLNTNPIFHAVRPAGSNTIQIGGGTHIASSNKPLPTDIQTYLDHSKNGVIYFNLGTNVKSSLITEKGLSVILQTLAELPYDILWKFEDENLPNKPTNVKILKWFPQQDVLRHPNIKLFITQCGLLSMEEAIFNTVPMIGIPFFGDQFKNAKVLKSNQFGKVLTYSTLNKIEFKSAILDVISNSTYKRNLEEAADLLSDLQVSGLESAVWWTEYVIRHGNCNHLKIPNDFPFYQMYMLDVIGFVIGILLVCLVIFVHLIKCCCCRCKGRKVKNLDEVYKNK